MSKTQRIFSTLILCIASVIWGFAFAAQKAASAVPALTLNAARSFIAVPFLLLIMPIFDRFFNTGRKVFSKKSVIDVNKTELLGGTVCGVALAGATFLQQFGLNSGTDAGKASFITALYVVLVPIYALLLKKRAPVNVWISLPIAVFGFYLLCITGNFSISGSDFYVLLCAFVFPIQILAIDRYSPRCDCIRMSFVQFLTSGIVSLAFALIFEAPIAFVAIGESIMPILYLGVMSSGIAYTLQIIGQRGANPAAATILLSLESFFGVIGSAIFLSERMSAREYLGCAVMFVAVVISQLNFKSRRLEAAASESPNSKTKKEKNNERDLEKS